MENMEKDCRCPYSENGSTKKVKIFGKERIACNVDYCPYENLEKLELSGEFLEKICKTNGIVDKIQIYDPAHFLV